MLIKIQNYKVRKKHITKITVIFNVLLFLLLLHPLLEAKENKYELGFSVGTGAWPSDVFNYVEIQAKETFRGLYLGMDLLEQEIRLKPLYRLHFQYNISSSFAVEGEFGHQKGSYTADFSLTPRGIGARQQIEKHRLGWSVTSVMVNVVYLTREPGEMMIPYGFIGLGFCSVKGEYEEKEDYSIQIRSDIDLALKAGGGVCLYLSKNLPLALNLRGFIMVLGAYAFGYSSPYGGSDLIIEGWNLIWGVELSLKFRL